GNQPAAGGCGAVADRPAALLVGPAAFGPHESCTRHGQCRTEPRGGSAKSVVLASNRGLDTWQQFLGHEVLAAALLDRFLHHATVFSQTGESYRLKDARRRRGKP